MGPRSQKRGNVPDEEVSAAELVGFNGAALTEARKRGSATTSGSSNSTLQWGRAHRSAETSKAYPAIAWPPWLASMGPRSQKRGNNISSSLLALAWPALQWGRAHRSAETLPQIFLCRVRGIASMGPRSQKRGNAGDSAGSSILNSGLQWGRAHRSAETG